MSAVEKEHPQQLKIVAREWLYLLASLFVGWVILPLVIVSVMFPADKIQFEYKYYLKGLVRGDGGAWFTAFVPYFALQLVRSIVWAVKALKKRPNPSDKKKEPPQSYP